MSNINNSIDKYKNKLDEFKSKYVQIKSETELTELFKGVVIIFIKDVILLYNKLLVKLPDLKYSNSSEKITNLHAVLNSLEGDGKLFNINCIDIILTSYISYIYNDYRDIMFSWDISKIKTIDENEIKETIITKTSKDHDQKDLIAEHFNLIPEIILIINNLNEKDILKLLYLLNNLNIIVDIYIYNQMTQKG